MDPYKRKPSLPFQTLLPISSFHKIHFQIFSKINFQSPFLPPYRNKSLNKNNTDPRINFHKMRGLKILFLSFSFFSLSYTRHQWISRGTRKEGFKEESLALQGDGKSGDGWLVRLAEEIRRDTLGDRDRDQFLEGYSRGRDGVVRLAHGWINYPSLQGEEERWMRPRCWESPALLIEPPIMLPTRSRFELIGRNKISDGHARFAKISRPSIIIRAEWGWYRGVGEKSTTREIREFIYIWTRSWNEFFFSFFFLIDF